jgi:hypothetical protein
MRAVVSGVRPVAAVAIMCAAFVAAHVDLGYAQAGETGFRGVVRVRARPIYAEMPYPNGSPGAEMFYEFTAGDTGSFLVTAGREGPQGRDVCATAVSGPLMFVATTQQPSVARQETGATYVWHVDVRLLELTANALSFDVSWQRTSHAAPDERLQYSQRLNLKQGESRTIDLIHVPGTNCLGAELVVEGDILDEPAVQGKTIEWDLWASTGPKTTARQRLRSGQGNTADFMFDPLPIPGSENDEHVLFVGTATGRVRLDGNIDVSVSLRPVRGGRMSQAELIATVKKQRQRYGDLALLRKTFVAKPGEAVKVVVPVSMSRTTTNPATGRATTTTVPAVYESSITVQAQVR